jgi:hypothetical protein
VNLLFVGPGGNDPANAFLERVGQAVASHVPGDPGVKLLWGATRGSVDAALQTNPDLLYFGHGQPDSLSGLVDIANVSAARGRVVMAFACSSARRLGVDAVRPDIGVRAYLGWTRPVLVPAGRNHDSEVLRPWVVPGEVLVAGQEARLAVEMFRAALEAAADRLEAEQKPDWATAVAHACQMRGIASCFVCHGEGSACLASAP